MNILYFSTMVFATLGVPTLLSQNVGSGPIQIARVTTYVAYHCLVQAAAQDSTKTYSQPQSTPSASLANEPQSAGDEALEDSTKNDKDTTTKDTFGAAAEEFSFRLFWMQVLPNLLGAMLGAMLAIPVGLWLDRLIKSKELRQRTLIVLQAVLDELNTNKNSLDEFIRKTPSGQEINYPSVTANAWKAAQSQDALATSNDYETRKTLLSVYERLEFISHIGQSLWDMLFTATAEVTKLEPRIEALTRILLDEARNTLPIVEQSIKEIQKRLR